MATIGEEVIGQGAELRLARAREIVAEPAKIEQVGPHIWSVPSQTGSRRYKVELDGEFRRCRCPDYVRRRAPCKHILAVWLLQTRPGEAGTPKKPRKQYPQNTAAYDQGQMEELRLVEYLLDSLVSFVPERPRLPGAPGRPSIPLRQALYSSILKVYSCVSSRRAHGFQQMAAERGYLSRAPSFMISSRILNRAETTPILYDLLRLSALPMLALEEGEAVALDSTGVQTTSFGDWREYRHGEKRSHCWLTMHAIVGTRTHAILNAIVTGDRTGDSPQFGELLRGELESGFKPGFLTADGGYLSKENYRIASDLGIPAFIKFKSNSRNRVGNYGNTAAWRKAYFLFKAHREEFLAKYHLRSNVEAVFSALKRKFGENIRSKNPTAQTNEVLCKVIAYNLTVVVHEMFENGIAGEFFRNSKDGSTGVGQEPGSDGRGPM